MQTDRHHLGRSGFALVIQLIKCSNQVGRKVIGREKCVMISILVVVCVETEVSWIRRDQTYA
jgi:hypothetical protein